MGNHASLLVFGRTASRFHLTVYQESVECGSTHARVDQGERVGLWPARPRLDDPPLGPHVEPAVCEGGPDGLEVLPRHIHVQAGDVLEPRPDCFPLRQIQPVTKVAP